MLEKIMEIALHITIKFLEGLVFMLDSLENWSKRTFENQSIQYIMQYSNKTSSYFNAFILFLMLFSCKSYFNARPNFYTGIT